MSFNLPVGRSVLLSEDCILSRPTLNAKIGQIANAWNLFEQRFAETYAYLVAKKHLSIVLPPFEGLNSDPVALMTFNTLDSFRPKQQLFETLLSWMTADHHSSTFEFYTATCSPRIGIAKRARNKLLHAVWGICDDYPDALVLCPIFGRQEVFREPDFRNELEKFSEALALLRELRAQLTQIFG